jgi:hypothetical protein
MFGDNLAVEHFAGERPIEINLERRAWTVASACLRVAYVEYITADLLRFNFWLNLLTAHEFILSRGSAAEISAPECWFPEGGHTSAVIDEIVDLVGSGPSCLVVRSTPSQYAGFAARLDEVKRRLRRSRIEAVLRGIGRPRQIRNADPNIYPLW